MLFKDIILSTFRKRALTDARISFLITQSSYVPTLKDIIPPQTRATLASAASNTYSAASKTVLFGGKSLWVVCTSVLLLGLPYALAFQDEQMVQEEERQRQLMTEGASGLMTTGADGQGQQVGGGQAKAAL